jgi:carboxypeptidase family protein
MLRRSSRLRTKTLNITARVMLIAFLLVIPSMMSAQGYFATLSGTMTDPSGAVIPGAKVTLLDQEKGYEFHATSDSSGRYLFRSIAPGLYTVSAEMPGFEKIVRTGIRVEINDNATANLTLKIAGSVQTVQVGAQTPILDTQDATTGQVINRKFINDLPLIDRYVMDLTFLTPGVTEIDDQCGVGCTGTNFISNGTRGSTADILMDGASITNFEPNGGVTQATYTPSAEAVEEFKVQQSNFSAEFGFSGASVVNMVTRSGSNSFHGSGYDFIRDQKFDANNWFNNFYGIPIAPLRRNNYGGTIGGPIFKNRTFFFFDYDGTRETTMSTSQAGVPSMAERSGDFGEVCAAQGGAFDSTGLCTVAQGQMWDPYSGVYDPNVGGAVRNTFIPYNNLANYASPGNPNLDGTPYQLSGEAGDLIDPVAQKMMSYFPEPNISGDNIYDNWIGSGPNHNYNDQFDIKIDHRFRASNLLSAKYSQNWNHNAPYNCFKNFTDPCAGGPNTSHAHLFTITDTHTFSPTLLLNSTLGFTRGSLLIFAYSGAGGVTDPLGTLGFPAYLGSGGWVGVPAMYIGGGYFSAGSTNIGTDPYGNYKQGQDTGQLTFTLSKQLGPQELKFGFEGRLHQQNYIQTNAPEGTFSFDEHGSSQCPNDVSTCGGDGMASFMMGNTGGGYYEIQFQPATQNYQFAGFVQDNWKVNPKLTLNIGLRYDVSLPRTDRHNRQNWFDPNIGSPLQVPDLGPLRGGEVFASSHQRTITDTDWKDVQPRFGFAYQLSPLSVVRGGYGIYYSQTRSGANGVGSYGTQGFNQSTNMVTTYLNDGATPYLRLGNPYPNGLIQPAGSTLGLMNDVGFGAIGPIRSVINTPYEQSWSFGFEHQWPWNVLMNLEYIGKKGTHLYFGGANQLNILGPEIETYSADQIAALNTYVDNPFYGIITDPNSPLSSSQVQQAQLEVPYPQFTYVTSDVPPIANSIYHGLQVTIEKNYSNGLQLLVSYVWSKSIDDSSVDDDNVTWLGSFLSLQDPNKPGLERSLSTFDIPHVFQFSYTYDLPVGRGKAFLSNMPRVLDAVIGGWKTNGVWRESAGRPLAMSTYDGTSLPTYGSQRPNLVGQPRRNHGHDWINNYFSNPEVFQLPPLYALGNTPRTIGSVRTPSVFSANLSVEKQFSLESLRKDLRLELRLEAQNAFNHPVFGTPDTAVDDPSFGVISYTANAPRQVQLGLKVYF